MKDLMFKSFLLIGLFTGFIACNDDDDNNSPQATTIAYEELPQSSKAFLDDYFADKTVSQVKKYSSPVKKSGGVYSVLFQGGYEVDFDANGDWTEIESKNNANPIPDEFILEPIRLYVSENYPGLHIIEIEKENYGYQVELSNDVELKFSKTGEFLGIDDQDDDNKDESRIAFEKLPQKAQDFVNANFTTEIAIVKSEGQKSRNNEDMYELYFTDGTEIEFNKDGEWLNIDGQKRTKTIPDSAIPANILAYTKANYPNAHIEEIEKEGVNASGTFDFTGYEVDLSNGVELKFSKAGDFLSIGR